MLYKINNDLVDMNPASFFHHSEPRTRGAQRLHQEQAQHHVLCHSFPSMHKDCTRNRHNTMSSATPSPVQSLTGTSSLPLFLPLWPKDWRGTKTAPGTGTTACPLPLLLPLYSLWMEPPPYPYFCHSDPRTRGAQRLHQEQTQHYDLFHSFPCTVSDWNLLPTAVSSAPSLQSFLSRLGRSLHNLQPAPTLPWTPGRSCIQF